MRKIYCRCYWGEIIVLIFIVVLSLAGCAAQPTYTPISPTFTPPNNSTQTARPPTLTPTIKVTTEPLKHSTRVIPTIDRWTTPTSVPQLQSHTWKPNQVLIDFGHYGGDAPIAFHRGDNPPALILYADGRLIFENKIDQFSYEPMMTILERDEMCRILNTIDQTGFFDYQQTSVLPLVMGSSGSYINVNAWKSHLIDFQYMRDFVQCVNVGESEHCNSVTESTNYLALVQAFSFLDSYSREDLKPYIPEKYVVYLYESIHYSEEASYLDWPYSSLAISELVSLRIDEKSLYRPLIIDVQNVPDWINNLPNDVYIENGKIYGVHVRPLWPYEYLPVDSNWNLSIPDPAIPPPNFTLSCSPEDGILPIPEYP